MYWVHSQICHSSDSTIYNPIFLSLSSSSPPSSSSSSSSSPSSSDYKKQLAPPHLASSSGNRLSPAVIFIIVILAVVFLISGILQLLVRLLIKHRSSASSISQSNRFPELSISESDAYQRQLQQLFHLHDSGLDQGFIDALPVFYYKEIIGLKEPFDCAVCLCQFSEQDMLRLLPICNHAFHIDCIDTWLMSNSTCPLCRGSLYDPGFAFQNPVYDFEDPIEDGLSGNGGSGAGEPASVNKHAENHIMSGKRVFSVRLGKFKSSNNGEGVGRVEGESSTSTSTSNLDARRCYSMGSFQYVVADSDLQVALCPNSRGDGASSSMRQLKGRVGQFGNCSIDGDIEGKKINIARKGESFSVSKIWLWSRKDKVSSSQETQSGKSHVIGTTFHG